MDNFDQLSSLLAPILNDPKAMAEIAQAAAQMGLGDVASGDSGAEKSGVQPAPSKTGGEDISGDILSALGRITPLLSGNDDETARLLGALRPFVHGERAKRLDDAQRMLKLLRIAGALRGQGLL